MRISDWSSDVCSSDLTADAVLGINHIVADIEAQRLARHLVSFLRPMGLPLMRRGTQCGSADSATQSIVQTRRITRLCYRFITETAEEIGRAACRERVCKYVEISVARVTLKKKKTK